ncbi:HET domain-containing protein [Fusarium falciforme]|uniref:HET domain-containing protein n=1 Tax=Fusarium falciforme TaxID=195108 RepID=UPI0022FFDACA|nr:HET domain-containing protein [Fusarium falciforme]WAO85929.1 HET domain-containing protein [Fusarium falciforme]
MADRSLNPGPAMGASTAAQLYNTVPIPRNSQFIRVLDIPAQNSASAEGLTGTLRTVDLRDSPKYTALSYAWGESSNKSITCNGHYVAITDSCFKALSSLRKVLGSFTIWVDAICINQMDNDEKSTQIPLMRKIYTWAKNVYLWLGLASLVPRGRSMETWEQADGGLSRASSALPKDALSVACQEDWPR